jgi:predicted CoA-binding protein
MPAVTGAKVKMLQLAIMKAAAASKAQEKHHATACNRCRKIRTISTRRKPGL